MAREIPVLMSAPMVRAILAGAKTQTRRLITVPWHKGTRTLPYAPYFVEDEGRLWWMDENGDYEPMESYASPYKVGTILWVRETWGVDTIHDRLAPRACAERVGILGVEYRATCEYPTETITRWRPSIFMPRKFARILLRVEAVRIEWLQAITEADAIAEAAPHALADLAEPTDARALFARLWDTINGKRAPWQSNPWVRVVTFSRVVTT